MMTTTTRSLLFTAASALALSTSLGVNAALAGSASDTMLVSVSVSASCSITTSSLPFGAYDPLLYLDKEGGVDITCTNGSEAEITLGQGNNPDSGSTDANPLRRMKASSGDNYLSYSLYQDSSRTIVWGNTAGSGVSVTGTGDTQTKTVYGRIPPDQSVPVG